MKKDLSILSISSLYEECVQLKKSLQNSEDLTKQCYNLYELLKDDSYIFNRHEFANKLLHITGQMHELKKDTERIYTGVSNTISNIDLDDYMNIFEICSVVINANKKYAMYLNKNIEFQLNIKNTLPPIHLYTTLSLLNNLVGNAVESIKGTGLIKISIDKIEELLELTVLDSGKVIPENKRELIFKPGYTTKYDKHGNPSTGMGLYYVKELVDSVNGTIFLTLNDTNENIFIIRIPIKSIIK